MHMYIVANKFENFLIRIIFRFVFACVTLHFQNINQKQFALASTENKSEQNKVSSNFKCVNW